jgi:hypothetical protein
LIHFPDLSFLENQNIDNPIILDRIFLNLINELKASLNLGVINENVRIKLVEDINDIENFESKLFVKGVNRYLSNNIFYIYLFKDYKKYFPFIMLQSAYLTFVPDELKNSNLIFFAINQFVEFNLQEFQYLNEWKLYIREKYLDDNFRFDKFMDLNERGSKLKLTKFFFQYIKKYKNLDLDENVDYFLDRMYEEFIAKSKFELKSDNVIETLRVLTKIYHKVKNCGTLKCFFNHFRNFKKKGLIQTNLSLRNFKKNFGLINRFSFITPTYYFDWKSLNIAIIPCYLKFNPLIEKIKIDKIVKKMPFLVMPKLSVSNFAIELSAYFVIPRIYIKKLKSLIIRMEGMGFIIKKHCILAKNYTFFLNLNYFREFLNSGEIINPKNRNYSEKYEMLFFKKYSKEFNNPNLNILDFLILDRIRFFSFVGISFSRSKEIANIIKSDLTNFLYYHKKSVDELKKSLDNFIISPKIQKEFLEFIKRNQYLGFFYILAELEKWTKLIRFIKRKPHNSNEKPHQNDKFLNSKFKINLIEDVDIYEKFDTHTYSFNKLILQFLNSKKKFEREAQKILFFYQFLNLCSKLKIFNLETIRQMIENNNLLNEIIEKKKESFLKLKKKCNSYKISNKSIDKKINQFTKGDPKYIKPYLIDSIWDTSIADYFPQVILKSNENVKKIIEIIRIFFPKTYYYEGVDLFSKKGVIFLQLYLPYLNGSEKEILLTIFTNLFTDNIISFKRYSWNGFLEAFSRKDFYDFENNKFFFNDDLFHEFYIFIERIFGKKFKPFKVETKFNEKFWTGKKEFIDLIQNIRKRKKLERILNKRDILKKLFNFNINLEDYLFKQKFFKRVKDENFFKRYIGSIQIFPILQHFGLESYFLYITPFNLEEIDFKLLFMNTFQKVKLKAQIDESQSFLIKYIFPHNNPNTSYLNWLRSKLKIREYCLFSVKSFLEIFHFDINLSSNGWYLDPNNFKIYIQNILSDSNYNPPVTNSKSFKFGNLSVSNYYGPSSPTFKDLIYLYNRETIDIKRNLNLSNYSVLEKIGTLMKKKIIFPYITFKNLGLKEKINIMLLNLQENSIEIIKRVFQYFNLVYLFEIEGEYHIHGLDEPQKIRNGLMIKLYLPDCELAEILRILEYVFQYLEVEKYLIIPDLVDGESFLKTVYGDISFLEDYNPLNNLIWNERTKTWKNHTLFTQNFEYIYPELK